MGNIFVIFFDNKLQIQGQFSISYLVDFITSASISIFQRFFLCTLCYTAACLFICKLTVFQNSVSCVFILFYITAHNLGSKVIKTQGVQNGKFLSKSKYVYP